MPMQDKHVLYTLLGYVQNESGKEQRERMGERERQRVCVCRGSVRVGVRNSASVSLCLTLLPAWSWIQNSNFRGVLFPLARLFLYASILPSSLSSSPTAKSNHILYSFLIPHSFLFCCHPLISTNLSHKTTPFAFAQFANPLNPLSQTPKPKKTKHKPENLLTFLASFLPSPCLLSRRHCLCRPSVCKCPILI